MVKLKVGEDIYYILEKELKGYGAIKVFEYDYSRKDLIQVNQVVHKDFLDN